MTLFGNASTRRVSEGKITFRRIVSVRYENTNRPAGWLDYRGTSRLGAVFRWLLGPTASRIRLGELCYRRMARGPSPGRMAFEGQLVEYAGQPLVRAPRRGHPRRGTVRRAHGPPHFRRPHCRPLVPRLRRRPRKRGNRRRNGHHNREKHR